VLETHANANIGTAVIQRYDLERLCTVGRLDHRTAELELRAAGHDVRDLASGLGERRENIDRLACVDVSRRSWPRRNRGFERLAATGREGEEGGKPHPADGNPPVIDPTHRRHRYPPAA
jgi:hypothetical protein